MHYSKHMFWVLKRTVSLRQYVLGVQKNHRIEMIFFDYPQHYVLAEK